jgi:enediyne biosynthesis protein E4
LIRLLMHTSPRRASARLVLFTIVFLLLASGGVLGWFCFLKPGPDQSVEAALPDGPIWFKDVTQASGLDFVHDPGPTDNYFMPQSMGSGCAFIHDGDGTLYIYLLHQGGPQGKKNQLFKQLGDGTFKDVSRGSGLDIAGWNTGVAVGDVNNDGLPDVVVTQFGGIKLFLNQGGGHFEDVTAWSTTSISTRRRNARP